MRGMSNWLLYYKIEVKANKWKESNYVIRCKEEFPSYKELQEFFRRARDINDTPCRAIIINMFRLGEE